MKHHPLIKKLSDIGAKETGYSVCSVVNGKLVVTKSRLFMHIVLKSCIINLLYRHHGLTCTKIGRHMGVHHSTVIHHLQSHQFRNETEDVYAEVYNVMSIESQKGSPFMTNIDNAINIIKSI